MKYIAPELEILELKIGDVICTSPLGEKTDNIGNEGSTDTSSYW